MKLMLINDGNYGDMEQVKFPVQVEGRPSPWGSPHIFQIHLSELLRVGADPEGWSEFQGEDGGYCNFFYGSEVLVVES